MLISNTGCSPNRRRAESSSNRIVEEETINEPLPPKLDISKLELKVHDLTNMERQKKGLSTLKYDNRLSEIAKKHSEDMVKREFFSHVNPDGQDPTARGKATGYPIRKDQGNFYSIGLGENLFLTTTYKSMTYINGELKSCEWLSLDDIAKSTVDGWMNSPNHRKNMLDPRFDREGIGVALSSDYKALITQNLW